MTAEPHVVTGVLLDPADAAYLVHAFDVFGALAKTRGSNLTPRMLRLRETLAVASNATSDARVRTSVEDLPWQALSSHDLLDSAEAGLVLGISAAAARDLARRGVLPGHRAAGRWLYPREAVLALRDRRRNRRRTG